MATPWPVAWFARRVASQGVAQTIVINREPVSRFAHHQPLDGMALHDRFQLVYEAAGQVPL
jgi:hypothetical protein